MNTRILIVEDEHVIANNKQAFLEDAGLEVHCRASAEQDLELVGATGCLFDICIMDVRLPVLRVTRFPRISVPSESPITTCSGNHCRICDPW
jgi:DNA-binding response OmpR family regulator